MQMSVVGNLRGGVVGYTDANSRSSTKSGTHSVIDSMPEQKKSPKGRYHASWPLPPASWQRSRVKAIYNADLIYERHRHRYEFNNEYRKTIQAAGLVLWAFAGRAGLVEIVELPDHPWFIGVQFHPEFKSRPNRPIRCLRISPRFIGKPGKIIVLHQAKAHFPFWEVAFYSKQKGRIPHRHSGFNTALNNLLR